MTIVVELPIQIREVFAGDSRREESVTVACPRRKSVTLVDECQSCAFAHAISEGRVVCSGDSASSETFAIGADPRVDISAAAMRMLVRDIIPANSTCIRADVSVEMAAALLIDRDLECLPVVDEDDKLIGMVSRSDVLRDRVEGNEPPLRMRIDRGFHIESIATRVVSEIMTPWVHALPEDAPVSFAISLMAFESLHEVPIVSESGQVLGVATSLDLLRWLATRMGYVLAGPTTRTTRIRT